MVHRKRNLDHPSRRRVLEHIAREAAVTSEHMLDVIAKRKAYRLARMYRQRSRQRTLEKNLHARTLKKMPTLYAGEGALHQHLRSLGLSAAEFCRLADIPGAMFRKWYGHCLYGWPVEFLRLYGHNKAMERELQARGVDTEALRPQIVTRRPTSGNYPRRVVLENPPKPDWNPWDKRPLPA